MPLDQPPSSGICDQRGRERSFCNPASSDLTVASPTLGPRLGACAWPGELLIFQQQWTGDGPVLPSCGQIGRARTIRLSTNVAAARPGFRNAVAC